MMEFGGVIWPTMNAQQEQQTDWYEEWYDKQTRIFKALTKTAVDMMECGAAIEDTAKCVAGIKEWIDLLESEIKLLRGMTEKKLQEWAREQLAR